MNHKTGEEVLLATVSADGKTVHVTQDIERPLTVLLREFFLYSREGDVVLSEGSQDTETSEATGALSIVSAALYSVSQNYGCLQEHEGLREARESINVTIQSLMED